jgi:hypothetical protein
MISFSLSDSDHEDGDEEDDDEDHVIEEEEEAAMEIIGDDVEVAIEESIVELEEPRSALEITRNSLKTALQYQRDRYRHLTEDNDEMRVKIHHLTTGTHDSMSSLLQKQVEFESSRKAMLKTFDQEKLGITSSMDSRVSTLQEEIAGLKEQLAKLELKTQTTAENIHDALFYKEQGQYANAQKLIDARTNLVQQKRKNMTEIAIILNMQVR